MSEIKKILRCYKCGDILQDSDENGKGYIISDVLNNHTSDILLCNKCFEKTIFNNKPKINEFDDDLYTFLEDAQATDSLIVLVLDLFSFEGFATKRFIDAIGSCNVVVLANKSDLFPKNTDLEYLTSYVGHRLRVAGLNISDVFISSAKNIQANLKEIIDKINDKRARHDVYLLGLSNSGKTSLANLFLKNFSNKTNRYIQTITYPGTHTQVIEIPLDRTSRLYDIPGFSTNNAVWDIVEKSVSKQLIPTNVLEVKKVSLSQNNGFSFGGLARVQLLSKKHTDVNIYCSDKINIKFYFNADDNNFFNAIKKKTAIPSSSYLDSYECFDIYDIETTEEGSRDIGILGLGWFNFTGANQKFRITVPKGTYVYFSRAKVIYVKK